MTPEELLKEIAKIEQGAKERIEELCNKAKEVAEKPSRVWKPKTGDIVWKWDYCDEEPRCSRYYGEYSLDNYYEAGELFPTEGVCKEAHEAKVIQAKWKRLAVESGEKENLWDGENHHWVVYLGLGSIETGFCMFSSKRTEGTFFASEEAINAAVTEIGEENVKKYILGIKG